MIHLQSVSKGMGSPNPDTGFPFSVPVIAEMEEIRFQNPVTFFVGENGSGKSTLMEALAASAGLPTVGSSEVGQDDSLAMVRRLARHLRLTWSKRTHRGFFLRAEDFFGFARRIAQIRAELESDMAEVEAESAERSEKARAYARMPFARELAALESRYGDGLDARSHGEAFLTLFQSRFVPGGLYLLDEPEAPLSPLRQVGFLALLKEMVDREAQFVIATHSPILMAYPEADILDFDSVPLRSIPWDDLEHVKVTRDFLNQPGAFLNHIQSQ